MNSAMRKSDGMIGVKRRLMVDECLIERLRKFHS